MRKSATISSSARAARPSAGAGAASLSCRLAAAASMPISKAFHVARRSDRDSASLRA